MASGADADRERSCGSGGLDPPRDACYTRSGNELDAIEIVTRPERRGRITRSSLCAREGRESKEDQQLSYASSILGMSLSVARAAPDSPLDSAARSDPWRPRTRACTRRYPRA